MTRLILIRHGRSMWNAERRIQGQADPPLDDVGRQQAHCLAKRLQRDGANLSTLYTSPLQRASETAEIIGETLGVPVVTDPRLTERGVGDVTGLTWEEITTCYPDFVHSWEHDPEHAGFPGEEGQAEFRARVVSVFDEMVAHHAPDPVGVVSHGGTLGAYLNHLLGLPGRRSPFHFWNASLSIVEVNPTRPRVICVNDTGHLGGMG
jgi:probable phosphoglycerate mutase